MKKKLKMKSLKSKTKKMKVDDISKNIDIKYKKIDVKHTKNEIVDIFTTILTYEQQSWFANFFKIERDMYRDEYRIKEFVERETDNDILELALQICKEMFDKNKALWKKYPIR